MSETSTPAAESRRVGAHGTGNAVGPSSALIGVSVAEWAEEQISNGFREPAAGALRPGGVRVSAEVLPFFPPTQHVLVARGLRNRGWLMEYQTCLRPTSVEGLEVWRRWDWFLLIIERRYDKVRRQAEDAYDEALAFQGDEEEIRRAFRGARRLANRQMALSRAMVSIIEERRRA